MRFARIRSHEAGWVVLLVTQRFGFAADPHVSRHVCAEWAEARDLACDWVDAPRTAVGVVGERVELDEEDV